MGRYIEERNLWLMCGERLERGRCGIGVLKLFYDSSRCEAISGALVLKKIHTA